MDKGVVGKTDFRQNQMALKQLADPTTVPTVVFGHNVKLLTSSALKKNSNYFQKWREELTSLVITVR